MRFCVRAVSLLLALGGLATCLLALPAYFHGNFDEDTMKAVFLTASIVWFVSAGLWTTRRRFGKED